MYFRVLGVWLDHINELQLVHHRLEPYEHVADGPSGCVCHPYVMMVLLCEL